MSANRRQKISLMDKIDKAIINRLQTGFPIVDRPFAEVARELNINENALIERLDNLLVNKFLTRFGPMYDVERIGGAYSLVAMQVPESDFERVAAQVNALPEVAHNYQRDHKFNMWFVLATEAPERIDEINQYIEKLTGYATYNMPKLEEFYIGLNLQVE